MSDKTQPAVFGDTLGVLYESALEGLYDLNRKELRALAYEALLISDGPDRIKGSVDNFKIHVTRSVETMDNMEPKLFTISLENGVDADDLGRWINSYIEGAAQ